MSLNSAIEWTESTWNPVTGCARISAGCAHCYAERMARRLKAMGQANYARGFEVTLHEHALELPLRLKTPQRIFVIRDQCLRQGIPFFFKQWGGVRKKRAGRLLQGRTWDEMPGRGNLA